MSDTPRSRSQAVASQTQRSSERKMHSSEEGKNSKWIKTNRLIQQSQSEMCPSQAFKTINKALCHDLVGGW